MTTPVKTYTGGKPHHCTEPEHDDLTVAYLAGYHDGKRAMAERVQKLEAALKKNIRVYRVADEAWDPDAEVERLFKKEMGE